MEDSRLAMVKLCRRLLKAAKCFKTRAGSEEAVHKFRVYARRLVVYSRLAPGLRKNSQWQKLTRSLDDTRRRLGVVREIDVHRKIWGAISAHKSCGPSLSEYFLAQRERHLEKILKKSNAISLTRRLYSAAKKKQGLTLNLPSLNKACKRFEKVFQTQERFEKKRRLNDLHRVRIQIKKLRYILEPLAKKIGPGAVIFIRRLKAIQEQLGQVHDFETLACELKRILRVQRVPVESSSEIEALIGRLDKNIATGVELWLSSWPRHRRAFQSFLKKIKVRT